MVFTLEKSDLSAAYPESVAKLLIFLGKCDQYRNWGTGKELIETLLQRELPADLETGLVESVARQGLQ